MTSFRLITYRAEGAARAGLVVGDHFVDAQAQTGEPADATVLGILENWPRAERRLAAAAEALVDPRPLAGAHLLAPVHHPVTIYCAGANYTDHVRRMAEMLGIPPEPDPHEFGLNPWHFLKPSRTAVGPDATVPLRSAKLDWEVELAAVIGRTTRRISVADALSAVAGYTIANDLSARDFTKRPHIAEGSPFKYDWIGQKCFDGCCPLGPFLTPASQVSDPQNLSLKLWVNDDLKQDSNTGRMIFSLAEQISHLSHCLTLHPGDVILTGTPNGVGAESGVFLSAGDVVRARIEGLGELVTTIGPAEAG